MQKRLPALYVTATDMQQAWHAPHMHLAVCMAACLAGRLHDPLLDIKCIARPDACACTKYYYCRHCRQLSYGSQVLGESILVGSVFL